jgi:hypothetical protein
MALSQAKQAKINRHKRGKHIEGFEITGEYYSQRAVDDYLSTGTIDYVYLPPIVLDRIRHSQGRA